MRSILLSIRPWHCDDILSGKKKWEIRKTYPKELFNPATGESRFRCYLYKTIQIGHPVNESMETYNKMGRICGDVYVDTIWVVPPEKQISDLNLEFACITRDEFESYRNGRTTYWWGVSTLFKPNRYPGLMTYWLEDFNVKRAPQSWQYVEDKGNR